jgi:hypothetical protein
MSFLVIEVLSKGIIFGADRNVTTTEVDGSVHQNEKIEKVLKWPKNNCLVGYVGVGEVGGQSTRDWMNDFIQKNQDFISINAMAEDLRIKIEEQRRIDEGVGPAEEFIIHLGGFEKEDGLSIPKVYLITNIYDIDANGNYCNFKKEFKCTEEFWKYFRSSSKLSIKTDLEILEQEFNPFWFHQGLDLITFNVLHENIKNAFRVLMQGHPGHALPNNLAEWEKFVKMQILMFASYFKSFNEPTEQYVGGGVNICSIEWP